MEPITIEITTNSDRLDKYVTDYLKQDYDFSRSYVQSLIKQGFIKVNDNLVSSNYNLLIGDIITIDPKSPEELNAIPQDVDFEIVYQDKDIIVVNKPNHLVVHPAIGNPDKTLVNGLLFKIKDLSSIGGYLRPGIVHRLDKDTTGLMIVAKNDKAHKRLTEMLANNEIYKEYLALVHGNVEPNKGKIDAPIGRDKNNRKKMTVTEINSKKAVTNFEVVKRFDKFSLLSCVIETGRTHQIRVHMAFIKHPVLGDHLYAFKEDKNIEFGQFLHSHKLSFDHPVTNERFEFSCELPKEFNDKIVEIEK
ncbi:RluA family pseudouridine synthase [Spiroplasma tabanidicola]|uniref:Pseudouridine synthase n=1 Tax=Spiroplasma tabanidicola TaxID=324079 RepID=A0A6I6C951_9MOLU|nr:RluA family pseudouridine synthase [Spiroplasma tabanidicola]QGS52136.1 ribosomal large subunit pseudouridylate synthase D [Spiroplasma tabanidicola]